MLRLIGSRVTGAAVAVLLAASSVMAPSLAAQQTGTVTGQVTDSRTGNPLAASQVFIPDLDLGTLSQQNGNYTIENVPAGTHTVTVQRLGYGQGSQTVTVTAGETVTVNFTLGEQALQLDQVIVTGTPGGTQRRAIGNTVQRMNVADITDAVQINNVQDLLGARTPGLRLSVAPGDLGTGAQMTLRGISSFSTDRNQPLIYVDGIRVNNSSGVGPIISHGREGNALNDLNPDEIESIEIIKGPAAATLYGSDASSGVIQIITKRGEDGSPEFTFSTRQGANFITDPAGRLGTMWACPGSPAPGPACPNRESLVPYNMYEEGTRYIREGYFDWDSPNLFSYGHTQTYTADIRGGTSSLRYFLSASYDDQTGIVSYNTDEALRLRGNLGLLLTDNLNLDVSAGYVSGDTRYDRVALSEGGIWSDMWWSNGFWLDRITPFDAPGGNPRLGGFQEHLPSDIRDQTFGFRDYDRITLSGTLSHAWENLELGGFGTGALNQRAIVGIDRGWDTNTRRFPIEPGIVPEHLRQFTDTWDPVYTETVNGEMALENHIRTNLTLDYTITGAVVVNPTWTLETAFGLQYYEESDERFGNSGQGFASQLSTTINQISQPNISTSYSFIENKSQGLFVQQQVGWNDRAFLTGALRWDSNSTFGVDAPAIRYPKLSGTWVVSEENFWNIDALNQLRLRAAWGKAGRQPSALAGFNTFVAIPGPGGASAVRPASPGNPAIEPEESAEIEVGFDYALFNDRISGEFTYYTRQTDGALLNLSVPSSFGIPGNVSTNLGQIDAWGWELTVNNRVIENNRFSFDLDLGVDFNDNKIVSLGDYPGASTIRAGLPWPYNIQFDEVVDAEFMEPGDTRQHTTTNVFGDRIFATCDQGVSLAPEGADENQWGVVPGGEVLPCHEGTRGVNMYAGRAFAPWSISVAPRLNLLEGQLQVFALAEGQYGRWNHDNGQAWGHIYNNSAVARAQDDAWWVAMRNLNATRASREKSLYKADFWKLREIGAMYRLPQSLVQRTGASRASISVSGRNLLTLWQAQKDIHGRPVTDPEMGNSTNLTGVSNFWSAPPLSSFAVTARFSF